MIRHVVCFRLKDAGQIGTWQEHSAGLIAIETVRNFRATPLLSQDRFHCALYMEFDDEEGLAYYQKHPVHQNYVSRQLPPLVEEKLVVDLVE